MGFGYWTVFLFLMGYFVSDTIQVYRLCKNFAYLKKKQKKVCLSINMIINQIRIRVYKDIFTLDISTKYENFIDTTILLPTHRFFGTIIDVDY